jgi:hypothetical protein
VRARFPELVEGLNDAEAWVAYERMYAVWPRDKARLWVVRTTPSPVTRTETLKPLAGKLHTGITWHIQAWFERNGISICRVLVVRCFS